MRADRRRRLFDQNRAWVLKLARKATRRLPPSFDVEDLAQVGYAKMWEKIPDWDPSRGVPLQGFLHVYVYNAMLMSARGPKYRDATRPPIPERATADIDVPVDAERAQRFSILAEVIGGLDAPVADLLRAHYWEGRSLSEIAASRGITLPALMKLHEEAIVRAGYAIREREPELMED